MKYVYEDNEYIYIILNDISYYDIQVISYKYNESKCRPSPPSFLYPLRASKLNVKSPRRTLPA
jgi:hypothetical protein